MNATTDPADRKSATVKMSLTRRQELSIARLLSIPPVTRRGSGALQARMHRGARKEYETAAARMGFTPEQINRQWQDVRDMAELERLSDDED